MLRYTACLLLLVLFACRSIPENTSIPSQTHQAPDSPPAVTLTEITSSPTPYASATANSVLEPAAPTNTPTPTQPPPASAPDSQVFASISPENATRLVQISEIVYPPQELVTALAWSPDGDLLAVSAGNQLHLYQPLDETRLATLEVGAMTHSLAFSPNGAYLAAGSRDSIVRVWDVAQVLSSTESAQPALALDAHKKGVNCVVFSPDGLRLASGGNDAVARFWDPGSGEMMGSVIGGTFAVPAIAFSPGGDVLAVVNGNVIRLRDINSESILGTFLADASLYSLDFHPEGTFLAVGGTDNLVRLWRPEEAFRTGVENYPDPIILDAHNGDPGTYRALIWQVVFSPDGELLASAGGDATIRLWDISSGTLISTLAKHTNAVTSLAFSPDGRILASGGLDGAVRMWASDD